MITARIAKGKDMLLKIYFGTALLFFFVLLMEWAKREDDAPFWIVAFAAVLWPITLGLFIERLWTRFVSRRNN